MASSGQSTLNLRMRLAALRQRLSGLNRLLRPHAGKGIDLAINFLLKQLTTRRWKVTVLELGGQAFAVSTRVFA
jgi:hypothetical protein